IAAAHQRRAFYEEAQPEIAWLMRRLVTHRGVKVAAYRDTVLWLMQEGHPADGDPVSVSIDLTGQGLLYVAEAPLPVMLGITRDELTAENSPVRLSSCKQPQCRRAVANLVGAAKRPIEYCDLHNTPAYRKRRHEAKVRLGTARKYIK